MYQFLSEIPNDQAHSTIPDVAFSPDGRLFAATYKENNKINVYDTTTRTLLRSYQKPEAQLDWPHGLILTNRHIIVTNKHLITQPSTLNVYRIDDPSEKPVFIFTTPLNHLHAAHSIDINKGRLVVAHEGRGARAIVSYHYDDDTGVITGPTSVHESKVTFPNHAEAKGICFTSDGEKVVVTLTTEYPSTYIGMFKRGLRLLREQDGFKYVVHRTLKKIIRYIMGQTIAIDETIGHYTGLAVFHIDEHGKLSDEPIQIVHRSHFSRPENIHIIEDSCVLSDPANNIVSIYHYDGKQFSNDPAEVIQDHLSFPHDACFSPDRKMIVVANYGFEIVNNRPLWGKYHNPSGGKLTIHQLQQ